jgi:hypothetical protein
MEESCSWPCEYLRTGTGMKFLLKFSLKIPQSNKFNRKLFSNFRSEPCGQTRQYMSPFGPLVYNLCMRDIIKSEDVYGNVTGTARPQY